MKVVDPIRVYDKQNLEQRRRSTRTSNTGRKRYPAVSLTGVPTPVHLCLQGSSEPNWKWLAAGGQKKTRFFDFIFLAIFNIASGKPLRGAGRLKVMFEVNITGGV